MKYFFNFGFFLFLSGHIFSQVQKHEEQINIELLKGNYKNVIELTDTCSYTKGNTALLYKRALAFRLNYNDKKALELSTELLKREPDNRDFLLEQSKNLIQLNLNDDAKDTLSLLFYEIDNTNISAGLLLGKIFEFDENWVNSAFTFFLITKLDSSNTYALYHYAIALTNLKKGKEAIPVLKKVLALDPEHINSRYLLFRIYKALDDYDLAKAQIDTLKTIRPKEYKPWLEMAHYNFAKNYNYKALPEFIKAIELGYPDDDAHHYIGRCYYNTKKYQEAIPYLKYTTSSIEDFNLLSITAECYIHLNKVDSASFYYDKAYKLAMPDPSFLDSYYDSKAQTSVANGNFYEAISYYNKFIIQIDNLRWSGFYKNRAIDKIAEIYSTNLNNKQKALELYKEAISKISEYENPDIFNYFQQKIEKLNEALFFEGKDN
jgi:tetratricopeptide (TPR) repeat protein